MMDKQKDKQLRGSLRSPLTLRFTTLHFASDICFFFWMFDLLSVHGEIRLVFVHGEIALMSVLCVCPLVYPNFKLNLEIIRKETRRRYRNEI